MDLHSYETRELEEELNRRENLKLKEQMERWKRSALNKILINYDRIVGIEESNDGDLKIKITIRGSE